MKINRTRQVTWHLIFIITILLLLFPIVYALGMSFKPLQDAYNNVLNIIPIHPTLENYMILFETLPVVKITMNTFIIATVATIFKIVTSFIAAYAFVYFEFKGKSVLYFVLISTIFIPFTVTMIQTI